MSSFVDRKYRMALDLLSDADNYHGVYYPCNSCTYNDNEWCKNHCNKDTTPDHECYDKYFSYALKDELRKQFAEFQKLSIGIISDEVPL